MKHLLPYIICATIALAIPSVYVGATMIPPAPVINSPPSTSPSPAANSPETTKVSSLPVLSATSATAKSDLATATSMSTTAAPITPAQAANISLDTLEAELNALWVEAEDFSNL